MTSPAGRRITNQAVAAERCGARRGQWRKGSTATAVKRGELNRGSRAASSRERGKPYLSVVRPRRARPLAPRPRPPPPVGSALDPAAPGGPRGQGAGGPGAR